MTSRKSPQTAGAGNKHGVRGAYTFAQLKNDLLYAHAPNGQNKSLRKIAKTYGVSHGSVQRVLDDVEPMSLSIRAKFGLPTLALAPVCRSCGELHVTRRCTKNNSGPRRPRRNWRRFALLLAGVLVYKGT